MAMSAERVQEICDMAERESLLRGPHTQRLRRLIAAVDAVEHLKGDIVELGVFEGRTAKILALAAPNKTVHLFDTFKGITADVLGANDLPLLNGYFVHPSACEEAVRKNLATCPNVKFYAGPIEETVPAFKAPPLSFIHFDCDTYGGYSTGLKVLWSKLEMGGYCLFHDYQHVHCVGATKAVDEFLGNSRKKLQLTTCGFLLKKGL